MNRKLLLVPFLLAGCGGEEAQFGYPDMTPNEVTYSYPYDGQQSVSRRTPVMVRLSDPLVELDASAMDAVALEAALADVEAAIELSVQFQSETDDAIPFEAELVVQDPQADVYRITTMMLKPLAALAPAASYTVDFSALETPKGPVAFAGGELDFTTAGMATGPRTMADVSSEFAVTAMIPDGETLPFVDFSTLRLQFSQPLNPDTVVYGETISLLDESDALVPASVLVSGYRLTIDPVDDLMPNRDYTLVVPADALRSIHGDALVFEPVTMTAGATAPRETMAQEGLLSSADPLSQCDASADGVLLSPLTGQPINCVPVESVLLGDESVSQAMGDLYAELAFVPRYPNVTPLRVPRGTLLSGSSLDVLVAGHVPMWVDTDDDGETDTPLASGDLSVTFVADASGFLMPNPYSIQEDAPRHVRLYLDVAMTAETTEANGSLSQDLLHVEVVGTAIVKDGLMVIDAIGAVEPEVLGLENAYGLLSFHLESYADQGNAPALPVDIGAPGVQSWVPGDGLDAVRPGQPIIVNFSEPVARESLGLDGAVTLTRNGGAVAFDWRLDGSALVIEPDGGLVFSSGAGDSDYVLSINSLVTDLAGNPLDQDYDLAFTMPMYLGTGVAPFATATYPGFPCARSGLDLGALTQGRCLAGENTDDLLPVMDMPENRSIYAQFSQPMSSGSFVLGDSCDSNSGTFHVQTVDGSGACTGVVPGRLDVSARFVKFTPDEPWQQGAFYRYVLAADSGACGSQSLCSGAGTPLQTQLLGGEGTTGPDMTIYFRGGSSVDHVFQVADNMPSLDVNSNFIHEGEEPDPVCPSGPSGPCETPPNSTKLEIGSTNELVVGANLGCGVGEDCNDKKFIYLTGALVADVVGWDESEGAIEIHVYPNMIMTTNLDSTAEIRLSKAIDTIITEIIPNDCWIFDFFCDAFTTIVSAGTDLIQIDLTEELATGPQIMRVRFQDNGFGSRTQPVTGWIREGASGPELSIVLDVYMDAPDLEPSVADVITMEHNLHSYPLQLDLSGPVTLLPDGRMRIQQRNQVAQQVDVEIGLDFGIDFTDQLVEMSLVIPEDGVNLEYLSQPVKK